MKIGINEWGNKSIEINYKITICIDVLPHVKLNSYPSKTSNSSINTWKFNWTFQNIFENGNKIYQKNKTLKLKLSLFLHGKEKNRI